MSLIRFSREPKKVSDSNYEVKEAHDHSAEVDQTFNRSKTESENSDDEPKQKEASELGLKIVTSVKENENEENKSEEQEPKPWEQAANNEQS